MWPLFSGNSGISVPGPGGVGVGGEPEFSPADIAGLAAHFDVSTGLTLDNTAPSTSVSQWASALGSSVLSQGTKTRQPVVLTSTFGSDPGLDYDASLVSDLSFDAVGCALTNQVSGFSVVLVCRPDGVSTDTLIEFSINGSNSVRWGLGLKSMAGQNQMQLNARRQDGDAIATLNGTVAVPTTGFSVLAATVNYTTGAAAVYVDGALAGSDASLVSTGATTDATDSTGAKLGRAVAGGAILDGVFGDVLIYQSALSATDVSELTGWLQGKLSLV